MATFYPTGTVGVQLDDAAIEGMLNDIDGPVGRFLVEISEEMAVVAKAGAPVMKPWNMSWGARSSSYGPPGMTKASVHAKVGYGSTGKLYGGVNAAMGPTVFLQKPAKQMHTDYPFLTDSLYAVGI